MMRTYLLFLLSLGIFSEAFIPSLHPCPGFRSTQQTIPLHATSSSELKDGHNQTSVKRKYPRNSVVSRLKLAATRAHAAANREQLYPTPTRALPTLKQVTRSIDSKLQVTLRPGLNHHGSYPVRDTMTALLFHNNDILHSPHRRIAVLFCKPLLENRISVEHALRIQRLVKAITEEDYRPDVICFVSANSTDSSDVKLAHAHFLETLSPPCESAIVIIKTSEADGGLEKVKRYIDRHHLDQWELEVPNLRVQVDLFSSDYHLCKLYDIHVRSPRQSVLQVFSSWSIYYWYVTTVKATNQWFPYSQQLVPVLQNLKGVSNSAEFFQRDNYRTLTSVRRSLVTYLEDWQNPPALVEQAVWKLGRCADLVRPAGLLTGIVEAHEYRYAATLLEQAIEQIVQVCDPDKAAEEE